MYLRSFCDSHILAVSDKQVSNDEFDFGLFTQVSNSGPHGPLGNFLIWFFNVREGLD